jgi:hypothetical protein
VAGTRVECCPCHALQAPVGSKSIGCPHRCCGNSFLPSVALYDASGTCDQLQPLQMVAIGCEYDFNPLILRRLIFS